MLNWDDLRVFLAVAREGGLMPAARKLGVDHTTVARRLTALENAVGARLVDRSPRGVRLTDAGATLTEHAERIEGETLAAGLRLNGADQKPSGVVRLATPEAFGVWLVAPFVKTFHRRYPDIQLELAPKSQAVSLSKRDADIAITLSRPVQGRLYSRKLVDYRLGLYASRAYLEAVGPIEDMERLRDVCAVSYIDDLIDLPELRYLDQISPQPRTIFRSNSIVAQQAAVAAGLGVGLLHIFSAGKDPGLVRVLADSIAIERGYWLAVHADQRHLPRIRAVVDFLQDIVREHRGRF
jgi:DNA-binding transcriptional LysR family regulator